jgi:hypothetical protein
MLAVFAERPADQDVLLPAIAKYKGLFDRAPGLVSVDAGFFSAENEAQAKEAGVARIAIPNKQTRSPARSALQQQRWFRHAQHWRWDRRGG